jgi:hypothetical protein
MVLHAESEMIRIQNLKMEIGFFLMPTLVQFFNQSLSNETKDAIQVMNAMTRSKDNLC